MICKAKVSGFSSRPFGLSLSYNCDNLSYGKEIIIVVSGAAANLICSAPFMIDGLDNFTKLGLALAFFNLLPIFGSDGTQLLEILLSLNFRYENTYKAVKLINIVFAFLLWIFAIILQFRYKENVFLLLFSVYLLIISLTDNRREDN